MTITAPELLMPAGDFEKMQFAFTYGADAVYAGVPIFSLRARENAFNKQNIAEAIQYAHNLGKKLYLTMNIYAHNSKVQRFIDSFLEMYDLNPDAFIMTDAGLIKECLRLRPDAVIHLSTQANVTNWTTAAFWRDCGVRRIILSRELSLTEIAEIHERVPNIELEAFVQGAICVAYSGRCLISNYLSHRDANQGACTNSCRWQYKIAVEEGSLKEYEQRNFKEKEYEPLGAEYYVRPWSSGEEAFMKERFEIDEDEHGTYLMNSKDLCAIELLPELIEAGVCSLKSEGRTKSEYFVAMVSRAYRRAIDDLVAGRPFNKENLVDLVGTQNRTMTTGFLMKRPNEYGQNYDDGWSAALNHRYAGRVKEYDDAAGIAWLEVKNRFSEGEMLEWITPTETISMPAEGIMNKKGIPTDVAHGGQIFGLKAPKEVNNFVIIRQKCPEQV